MAKSAGQNYSVEKVGTEGGSPQEVDVKIQRDGTTVSKVTFVTSSGKWAYFNEAAESSDSE